MGHIVTPQDVVAFLGITTRSGSTSTLVTVNETSDPSKAKMDMIIEGIEEEWDEETHHSWGHLSVAEETHDLKLTYEVGRGLPIHLAHRQVATMSYEDGDRLEMWNGREWEELLQSSVERYRQLEGLGKIYIRALVLALFREDRIRVKYRYGTLAVSKAIKFVLIKRCAAKLLESSFAQNTIQFGVDRGVVMSETLAKWEDEYDRMVFRWQDITRVEY